MIRPMRGYVLLHPEKKETTTASGIIIETDKDETTAYGIVVALGEGVAEVEINERVFYNKYMGEEIDDNQVVIKPEYIYCVIE